MDIYIYNIYAARNYIPCCRIWAQLILDGRSSYSYGPFGLYLVMGAYMGHVLAYLSI